MNRWLRPMVLLAVLAGAALLIHGVAARLGTERARAPSRVEPPSAPAAGVEADVSLTPPGSAVPAHAPTADAERETAPALPPPPAVEPAAVSTSAVLARLRDSGVPVEERLQAIRSLAEQAGEGTAAVLMALGNEDSYLNAAAISALGTLRAPEAIGFLQGKLAAPDPKVAAAAAASLVAMEGERAVGPLAAALGANRDRPDGYQDMVCEALVDALTATHSATAVAALAAELDHAVGHRLGYDYGSRVVLALKAIGASAGRPPIEVYIRRLEADVARQANNPLGQSYLRAKIAEGRAAADALAR